MTKGKFIQLFSTLERKTQKEFSKYLKGLYGNQIQLLLVFEYIDKHSPNFDTAKLKKDNAICYFAKKGIAPKILNNRLSNLYKHLEDFLIWQRLKNDKHGFERKATMLSIWKERKLKDWFFRDIAKYKTWLAQQPKDIWHHYKLMYLSHQAYFTVDTDTTKVSFSENLNQLEDFFVNARLMYHLIELNRHNLFDEPKRDYLSFDTILGSGKLTHLKDDIFIILYLKAIDLLRDKKEIDFFTLKSELFNTGCQLSDEDQLILFTILSNYASIQMRKGNYKFIKEKINLFQYGLNSGIQLVDGYLDSNQLISIVNLACTANEIALAYQLKKECIGKTIPKERKAVKGIIEAIIHFHEGKYGEVLENLREIKFHNEFYAIRSKALILLSMMMTQTNSQVVLANCQAFDVWLRRENKLSKTINMGAKNMVKLVKLYYQKRNEKYFDWSALLQKTTPLFHAHWFKDQFLKKLEDDLMPQIIL